MSSIITRSLDMETTANKRNYDYDLTNAGFPNLEVRTPKGSQGLNKGVTRQILRERKKITFQYEKGKSS